MSLYLTCDFGLSVFYKQFLIRHFKSNDGKITLKDGKKINIKVYLYNGNPIKF